jgi:uncharacterized protein YutE (UPF0331/DUF86 family)
VDEKYAIRYNIVVLVESLVSLCVHVASESFGLSLSSYREVVRVVAESVGVRSVSDLESVGLRNLLIHRYWGWRIGGCIRAWRLTLNVWRSF